MPKTKKVFIPSMKTEFTSVKEKVSLLNSFSPKTKEPLTVQFILQQRSSPFHHTGLL
ncbi:hypothetical protein [Niallia sp. MER TA 168]|uniref:Uncharacterized protein n=1 Tax=Niallia hominis TaxID=3133173 RepID=A0ABV1F0L3_9BACI|nr:hypothetical protein [Niallia sp. MER TA 168]